MDKPTCPNCQRAINPNTPSYTAIFHGSHTIRVHNFCYDQLVTKLGSEEEAEKYIKACFDNAD
jgi:hypothetical protein